MSKLITVVGATGNQGGSVIKSILADPELSKEYKIRGITRDPLKPKGEKLKSQGVEVVAGDLGDKASLVKAFEGSYAVYGVTNFWELFTKEAELKQGHNIVDAAKEAGVKVLVWSSLPHVTEITNGALPHVDHFDGKAEIGSYAQKLGIPTVEFQPGFYMSNLKSMVPKNADGSYTIYWPLHPTTKIHCFDAEDDTGKFVAGILANPEAYTGKKVFGYTATYTPEDIVKTIEEVGGVKVSFVEVPEEAFKKALPMPPALQQEMLENFLLIRDYGYYGKDAKEEEEASLKVPRVPLTSLAEAVKKMGPW